MKILQVINNLGSGGAEKLLELMVPLMNEKKNITVDIIVLTDKGNVYEDVLNRQGVNIKVVKYNNIYDPRNIIELQKHIKKGQYDVIHSHIFPTQYWVTFSSLFLKNQNIKFVTTEHSTSNRRRTKKYLRPLEKWMYSRYDTIIAISDIAKNKLINWTTPNEKRLNDYVVVENGINIDKVKLAKPYDKKNLININSLSKKTKFITMVGRFSEAKDQPTLIEAVSKLPNNYHLIFLGEGPLMNDNIELAKKFNINERVHFLGFRQDVERILQTSDIIVLSTHWEGLSLASVEGLASGKPFIGSAVPGVEEIVADRGLLFEEGNVDELASIIIELMNNDKLHNTVIKRSLEASQKYNIKNTVSKLLEIYTEFNF